MARIMSGDCFLAPFSFIGAGKVETDTQFNGWILWIDNITRKISNSRYQNLLLKSLIRTWHWSQFERTSNFALLIQDFLRMNEFWVWVSSTDGKGWIRTVNRNLELDLCPLEELLVGYSSEKNTGPSLLQKPCLCV